MFEILFKQDIDEFLKYDRKHPPVPGGVLFTGSSIFRFWESLCADMAPLPILNRAFGGARTWEVLHYMDRIVLPYRPRIIVYYCGSNDVEAGARAEEISERFQRFAERAVDELPDIRLFFVSINQAPQKLENWHVIGAANALAEEYCRSRPGFGFIDVNPALFDVHGRPRYELYREDGLHLKPEAYREFTRIVKPVLLQAWEQIDANG